MSAAGDERPPSSSSKVTHLTKRPAFAYTVKRVVDIMAYEEPDYLIDPLLMKGTVNALGARPGDKKSLLALSIIKAVVSGESLWERYHVEQPGPVLLVDEETPRAMLKERVAKAGLLDEHPLYLLHFAGVQLDDDTRFRALLDRIEEVKPVLLVIDSLIRVHRKQESDAGEMAQVMARLRQIAESGVVVLFIHHHKKGGGPQADKLRGSSDILAAIDVEYSLVPGKTNNELKLSTGKTRIEPFGPVNLKFTFGETENTVRSVGSDTEEILQVIKDILEGERYWGFTEIQELLQDEFPHNPIGINRLRKILGAAKDKGELQARPKGGKNRGIEYRYLPYPEP